MTCIVALESGGKVWMGGDSASTAGSDLNLIVHPKVFVVNDFLIGYTTSFRMGQLLQYCMPYPENQCNGDDMRYMVAQFIPAVQAAFKSAGFSEVDNNVERGGCFLVGYHGLIYSIYNDFQVTRHAGGFMAFGAGESYALGALAALDTMRQNDPESAIRNALVISERYCSAVRGPFCVVSL